MTAIRLTRPPSRLLLAGVCLVALWPAGRAAAIEPAELPPDFDGRKTAAAINYCRASFHRIRKYPSKRVLLEEQEQILNNLNLNGIADEEVVRLYSTVLAEVGDVQVAEQERALIQQRYRQNLTHNLTTSAWSIALSAASMQYMSAVRAGAASFWDYRNLSTQRDFDSWKVEKQRMTAVVDKSSNFLDTFWKLARKRNIPDEWLVRSADLDRLETAMREPDGEVRLRVLRRMEPFMDCYPPYHYYVARTEQSLGRLSDAAETYQRLAALGEGHFRKDEMMAAGMANLALIQDHLRLAGSAESARQALRHSTDAWQVNLICSQVLARHGGTTEAEDALLRNLDVELEQNHSLANLVLLYARSGQTTKLAQRVGTPETVRALPVPVLVECAAALGNEHTPAPLLAHLNASLYGFIDRRYGRDDIAISALPCWDLANAKITLHLDRQQLSPTGLTTSRSGIQEARFRGVTERGTPLQPAAAGPVTVSIAWYGGIPVRLQLQPGSAVVNAAPAPATIAIADDPERLPSAPVGPNGFRIATIEVGQRRVSLLPGAAPATTVISDVPAGAKPAAQPAESASLISSSVPTMPASQPRPMGEPVPRAVPVDVTPVRP